MDRGNHLPVTGSREVVFCHACENEWYRNRSGDESLECPSCHSSFTEIVDTGNDPRRLNELSTPSLDSGSGHFFGRSGGSDSDPDEGDIDDHLHDRPPLLFSRRSPFEPPFGARDNRDRTNMNEGDAILRRFADMLVNDFGVARAARGPGQGLFPPPAAEQTQQQQPGTRIHQTTFRAGPFGNTHTRVTITSGTFGGGIGSEGVAPNFGTLFGQIFGNPALAGGGQEDPTRRDRAAGQEPGLGFAGGLHEILTSLFNPAAAVSGDAVFTQEALDRIITQLMDASPQTNAAPPASQSAIENLEKKKVDDEMLGTDGKAECTICIDEIHKGEEVVVLPCKHWYHGECVVLWLKEHNTCPICRMSIETRNGEGSSGGNNNSPNNNNTSGQPSQQQQPSPNFPAPNFPSDPTSASQSTSTSASASTTGFSPFSSFSIRPTRTSERTARSARENAERLNAIRNLATGGSGNNNWSGGDEFRRSDSQMGGISSFEGSGSGSGLGFGSGLNRRSSVTPPGAWPQSGFGERERETETDRGDPMDIDGGNGSGNGSGSGGGRDYLMSGRRRSYVPSGSWREREREQQQQHGGNGGGSGSGGGGGGGPLGWFREFREHFGRGSGDRRH